jgi:hypothetical protein
MKTCLLAVLLAVTATAQTNITDNTGKVYPGAKVLRAEPDGLCVEYSPAPGATGLAKIRFAVLPPEIQKQYGYDPVKAAEFVALQHRVESNYATKLQGFYDEGKQRKMERERAEYIEALRQSELRLQEASEKAAAAKEKLELTIKLQELEAKKKAADAAMIQATRSYP